MSKTNPKIVVLDGHTLNPGDNPWDAIASLGELIVHERTHVDQIVERARDAEIVITNKAPLTADTIGRLPELELIVVTATGVNVVDLEAAKRRAIAVSNVPEYGTRTVAQFTIAMLLELCHRIGMHTDSVRDGAWSRQPDFTYWLSPQLELDGKTIGIVGFGRIGRRVGEIAHALGMSVIANARTQHDPPSYEPFAWATMDALFERSDIVTLHCPQTPETTGMINARSLAKMKRTALLLNASRGGLVIEQDLADALNNGVIAGAALDVLSVEPPPADHPLLRAKNCLITPHMAWTSLEARRRIMRTTKENIDAFLAGRPINVVG